LHGAHIEKIEVEVAGDLPDDLRFTDAAWSPDMQGHALANERMKRFIELGGFHGLSLEVGVESPGLGAMLLSWPDWKMEVCREMTKDERPTKLARTPRVFRAREGSL
jgi:hypothetical protein